MRLTIDNLDGAGEMEWTEWLDAEHPPKVVRRLNQAPEMTAWVAWEGAAPGVARAGSRIRLKREDGGLWFSGYLVAEPELECMGAGGAGERIFRVALVARGEMVALDHGVLSARAAMGGRTAGECVRELAGEANAGVGLSEVQDVAAAGGFAVASGERWSKVAGELANAARAALTVEERVVSLAPVGGVTRTLSDADEGFVPQELKLRVNGARANDITVVGGTEPALYVRDCFTASGGAKSFALSRLSYKTGGTVLVEDDFHGSALDGSRWVSDLPGALSFGEAGVSATGAVALRFRDRVELGGLVVLEQTGISYGSGQGVAGGLFDGGFSADHCLAGVMLDGGQVKPVVGGVVGAVAASLVSGKQYEFRTMVFHPEPIRAGQVYASSERNGAGARTSQVWFGAARVVLTMRTLDPGDALTTSAAQVVLYDGELLNAPAYADYLPLWGLSLNCGLGHAAARNLGAVWVQTKAPGGSWRTRLLGDVTAGAECFLTTTPELTFTTATKPVEGELVEVFYRGRGLACGRVWDAGSVAALANGEDGGVRSALLRVEWPQPRTSLDCEQAARALLDDMTGEGHVLEYSAWWGALPEGATEVQPGEVWQVEAAGWGVSCAVVVREVEVGWEGLSDELSRFVVKASDEGAETLCVRCTKAKHGELLEVVRSEHGEDVSGRPPGLPDVRVTDWGSTSVTVDAGSDPLAGGGFEVRVEGDWGWGGTVERNLVGRYSTRSIILPRTATTQEFYLRQYDGSSPAKYSPYASVLHLDV